MFRKVGGFIAAYFCLAAGAGALFSGIFVVFPDDALLPGISQSMLLANCIVNIILCGVSFLVSRKLFRPAHPDARSHEQIILDRARLSHGTVSIAEVAAHTALSVLEVKEGMEALTRQGVASVEFNENDDVFYRFPGLDSPEMDETGTGF